MKTVYLAGPITGCDRAEANDWRAEMQKRLSHAGIAGISPLRCEPLVGERYNLNYEDPRFGTPKAIASKNLYDVQNCDLTLAYLPSDINGRRPSYGTLGEIFWAHAFRRPVILVTDDPVLTVHPVVQAAVSWTLTSLDDAYDVILGVLGAYAKGR